MKRPNLVAHRQGLAATSLLGILLLVSACTAPPAAPAAPTAGAPAAPTTAAAAAPTAAAAAQKGGKLALTLPVEPDILDPHVGSSRYDAVVLGAIFDPLLLRDKNGEYKGHLLESWESSQDGLTWTFKLRPGVKFHDGTPLDAKALKFSFDRMVAPETKSQAAGPFLGPYVGSEIVDDQTLKVTFKTPPASLLDKLTQVWLTPVSPAAVAKSGQDFGTRPVGTGPFIFKEWVPKDHITVVRNPDYNWAPPGFHQGPVYLDEIRYDFIGEEISRVTALRNGETMAILYTPAREVEKLKSEGFQVMVNEVPGIARVDIINSAKAPTDELAVRQAILYGTNRQAITDVIDKGVGAPLNNVISPGVWGYDPEIAKMYPYDPAKAKDLLEKAGWKMGSDGIREKNGQKLKVLWVHFPGRTPGVPELIQGQLKELGIDMSIETRENPGNMQFARAGGHNLEWMTWGSTDPSILGTLYHSRNAGNGWNYAFYKDARLDEVLDKIDSTVDLAERKKFVEEAQKIIMEQALVLPLTIDINAVAMSPKLKDLSFGPDGFYRIYYYDAYVEP